MVVKIGMVEKDEPIPIVTRSPITSIRNARVVCYFRLYVHSFVPEIQHVLFFEEQRRIQRQRIITKPMKDIIRIPLVNIASASLSGRLPLTDKTIIPAKAPKIIDSVVN